jgi:hypothetical protein
MFQIPRAFAFFFRSSMTNDEYLRRDLILKAFSPFLLPRFIGYSKALRLVTTGEKFLVTDKGFGGIFTKLINGGAERGQTESEILCWDDIKRARDYGRLHVLIPIMAWPSNRGRRSSL